MDKERDLAAYLIKRLKVGQTSGMILLLRWYGWESVALSVLYPLPMLVRFSLLAPPSSISFQFKPSKKQLSLVAQTVKCLSAVQETWV